MASSVFEVTGDLKDRHATVYKRESSGEVTPTALWSKDIQVDMGGGGLFTTIRDYSKFVQMVLNKGKTQSGQVLVREDTLRMAMEGHLEPPAKQSINDMHIDTFDSKFPWLKRDHSLVCIFG